MTRTGADPGAGRRPRRRRVVALAAALAGLGTLPGVAAGTTAAAWSDAAVTSAVVTAGSWLPAGGGAAVFSAQPATVVTGLSWSVAGVTQLCVAVTVTTTSADPVEWRVGVAYAAAPFRGDTVMADYVLESDGGWVERLDDTPSVGQITFHGVQQPSSSRRMISLRTDDEFPSSVTFTLCNRNLPMPVYDATLTYQVSLSAMPTNPRKACRDATVAVVSATHPFYVGWQADLDLTPLLDLRRQAGLSTNVSIRNGGFQVVRLHDDVYRVTGTTTSTSAVRSAGGSDPAVTQAFTVCAG